MNRKDCDTSTRPYARHIAAVALLGVMMVTPVAFGGTARMWATAVVVDDVIRSDDICQLTGFDRDTESTIRTVVLATAPPPGGSRIIHMDLLRSALSSAGANMALVTFAGATSCSVSRPSTPVQPKTPTIRPQDEHTEPRKPATTTQVVEAGAQTLRQAVVDHFNQELARYGGTAEVLFDHTGEGVLDLTGPPYEFRIRMNRRGPLGMVPVEVDIATEGKIVQTVPLVVNVSLLRNVITARRAINQDATIRAKDLATTPMMFSRTDRLGLGDMSQVVGQRAKSFIPAGSMLRASALEAVPIVVRGQLVRLDAMASSVCVSTTAKATENGMIGDIITVQATDNRKVKFDAVVVAPGRVRIGMLDDPASDLATLRSTK